MSDQAAMRATARAAVDGLLAAVAVPLERNDLGRLARMHSWGQNLVEAASPAGGPVVGAAVGQVAHRLVELLERLILDEAAQPDRGTVLAMEAVRVIERAYRGDSVETDALLQQINEAIGAGLPVASPPPATTPEPQANAMPARGAAAAGEGYTSEPLVLDLSEREHLEGFLEEAAEHMDAIEAGLLDVEAEPENTTRINELFRPFHTIKGIAGFLNLRDINRLTHEIETILDLGRKNELCVTAATIDLIFAGVDVLKAQLGAIRQYLAGPTGGPCPQPEVATIIGKLRHAAQGDSPAPSPPARPRLGEVLVAEGVATRSDVQTALDIQASEPLPRRRLGEILVDQGVTTPKTVDRALSRQGTESALAEQAIRVDTRKLDLLVDAVGELVIAHSMVSLADVVREDEKLHRNVSQVTKIVRDVQATAMAMRMVPIGQTFQKMRRVVRDVARKAGKPVELTLNGEETELDKNVIQQISDPLVHMVRNAIDHGIEPAAERRRAGKPEVGQITLNAFHQGDNIVIEIRDDGRGLDREKLIAKGIERGLVSPGAELTEQQAFALVLQSGFSTAEKVTDISGRGVGMDVVHRNVEQLHGQIDIQSEKGRGTVFRVRLPLTLAIIDGMLVRVGSVRMIIPTILIEQSLRPERRHITTVQHRGAMLQVRGELCPLIPLRALFGYGEPADPGEDLVVIVRCAGQKIALVVDELIGQHQVVIKTLGARFKRVLGISGAAILGDGRVGLILEPTGLLALYGQQGSPACGPRPTSPDRKPTAGPAAPEHGPERASSALPEQETSSKRAAASPAERVAAPL